MNSIGFFGKMPGAGDFVRRRLPADFVAQWDRHFQRAVETGRRELGDAWSAIWRQAPTWRFAMPAHVCGASAWCGVLGAGFDRVGREYPMVVSAPCDRDVTDVLGNTAWFDALDHAFRRAVDDVLSVDSFDARIAAIPRPRAYTVHDPVARDVAQKRGLDPLNDAGVPVDPTDLSDLLSDCAHDVPPLPDAGIGAELLQAWQEFDAQPGPWCLWWTEGATRVLATRGLPSSYAVLLDPVATVTGDERDTSGLASGGTLDANSEPTLRPASDAASDEDGFARGPSGPGEERS
ncbi:type VI secretion system protein ImpM [Pararobbsia alpina]|uniref:type VI secretion system-associated protein TagF n=1 Tax=Pararobbsia alpina TaxID=621374 RepID=UPI0039A5CA03